MISQGCAFVGTVDTVLRAMETQQKRQNVDWVFCYTYNGLVPHLVLMKSIEAFCNTMAGLTKKPSRSERKKLKKLLDEICPVLDQNKLSDYIRKTAERIGVDYSDLEDSIRVDTEAHI